MSILVPLKVLAVRKKMQCLKSRSLKTASAFVNYAELLNVSKIHVAEIHLLYIFHPIFT